MTKLQLKTLRLTRVEWFMPNIVSLGFTLNDGQSCKAGKYGFNNSFDFPAHRKISKVEIYLSYGEFISQIIFYDKEGIIKKLG